MPIMPPDLRPDTSLTQTFMREALAGARQKRALKLQEAEFLINQKRQEQEMDLRRQQIEQQVASAKELADRTKNDEIMKIATFVRGQAEATPLADAPQVPIASQPLPQLSETQGAVSPAEAEFMGTQTPVPQRTMEDLTLADGRKIRLAPLRYKEEVERDQLSKRYAESLTSPQVIAAQIRADNPTASAGESAFHDVVDTLTGKPARVTYEMERQEPGRYAPLRAPAARGAGDVADMPGIEDIVPGDPLSIPPQYRDQVVAIAEGRQKPPALGNRPGSPGYVLMAYANAYDPTADFSKVNARWAARQERTKGSAQSRGGQLSRLNQLSGHTQDLAAAAKALDELSSSDYRRWNAVKMAVRPGGSSAPVARFNTAANTAIEEYIATITAGRPTNEEIKAYKNDRAGFDENASPAERRAAIMELKKLAEERANAMETWWRDTFDRGSVEMGDPVVDMKKGWTWSDDEGWKMNWSYEGAGGKKKTTAAPSPAPSAVSPAAADYLKSIGVNP